MKRLKKIWQGIFLAALAAALFPFVDITGLSFVEYMVLVLFAVNIGVEALQLCDDE